MFGIPRLGAAGSDLLRQMEACWSVLSAVLRKRVGGDGGNPVAPTVGVVMLETISLVDELVSRFGGLLIRCI